MQETNPNSLLIWFPKVRELGLPHPETRIIDVGWKALSGLLDRREFPSGIYQTILAEAQDLGFPLFMRTDLTSAKHHWKDTCFVEEEGALLYQLANLVDIEGCLNIRGWPSRAVVLREYVQLNAPFRAFRRLPIARERRYFAEGGKALCHHPYWPADAIEKGFHIDPLPKLWQWELSQISVETRDEVGELTGYAEAISAALPGRWSVDFAWSAAGKWLLIDMATAAESYHLEGCPNRGAAHD